MAWFFLSRILAAGLTVLTLLVFTRALEPEGFGRYNMIVLAATASFSILFGWVPSVIHRFHSAADFEGRATAWALGSGALLMVALVPVALLGSLLLDPDWRWMFQLGMMFCLAHSMNEAGLSGLRVYNKGPAFAIGVVLRPVVGVGLALLFVYLGGGYSGAIIGMAIGALVTGIYALSGTIPLSSVKVPHWSALKQFLVFGTPLAVVASNSMIVVLITQSLLAVSVDMAAVGTYAAAQTLALRAISLPMMTLTQATAASIFRAFEEHGEGAANRQLDQHFSFLMLVAAPILLLLVLANDTFSSLLFDENFQGEVAMHLPLLTLAAFISGVQGSYFAYSFLISRQTSIQFLIMAVGVAVHAGIAVLLISGFGGIGASYAILTSSTLSLAAYLVVGRSIRRQGVSASEVRKVITAVLVMAPFCLAADQTRDMALALLLAAAGCVAFFAALYYQKQIAAVAVARKLRGLRPGFRH
jgi:O-antigen/teichoic acid export membrane protein